MQVIKTQEDYDKGYAKLVDLERGSEERHLLSLLLDDYTNRGQVTVSVIRSKEELAEAKSQVKFLESMKGSWGLMETNKYKAHVLNLLINAFSVDDPSIPDDGTGKTPPTNPGTPPVELPNDPSGPVLPGP